MEFANSTVPPIMADNTTGVDMLVDEDAELDEDDDSWPLSVSILFGTVIVTTALVNIAGNSCTLMAFIRDPKLRTPHNCYIANLAATDLTVGVFSMPFYAVYTLRRYYWQFGYLFCKIWCVVDFLVCAESALTMILISYDRLLLMKDGVLYRLKHGRRAAVVKIAISWVFAFLLYGPAIMGFNVWRGYSTVEPGDCDVEFASNFLYTLITSLVEFGVPVVAVGCFSTYVFWQLGKRSSAIDVLPQLSIIQLSSVNGGSSVGPGDVAEKKVTVKATRSSMKNTSGSSLERYQKATKSMAALLLAFVVCWTPYTISTIILALCDTCISDDVYEAFNWLLWMNSAINPLLYALTNPRFRQHFRRMLSPVLTCIRGAQLMWN